MLTGSSLVATTCCEPDPAICGATTGWLASGGALDPLDGNEGSTGIDTAEVGELLGAGVEVDVDGVGVGGGFGVWVAGVDGVVVTGGGMNVVTALGVGSGASTVMVPWPVRIPSVAVIVPDFVAV